ncbi:Altered inheritance of mitochondria protein 9 [Lasiodiplodia theobromae]|uniref:Altered inheritance of mitochondria protein 9 n=1 Tax=Lasiodiplodia theobromae TaxID=45133 RepID=A0A5N5D4S5_9PEZI|nr:Altered inheritance of mitochondria protein 9 [Lasiodiplodia theobromae]
MASSQLISDDDGSSKNVALHADVADSPSSENESQQAGDTSSDNESQNPEDSNSNVAADAHTPDASDSEEASDNEASDSDEASLSDEDVAIVNLAQWIKSLDAHPFPVARLSISTHSQSFPFRVSTAGPPPLSTKLKEGIVRFKFELRQNDWYLRWQMEPDIDIIRTMIKPYALFCGLPNDDIKVEFLAQGMYNKVYTVQATNPETGATMERIFRCAAPDFPWYRVEAEVSTMELVRHHTTVPVPKIYAFDSSMDNALGLEWILMEKIEGQTLCDAIGEESISFESKVKIHEAMADWVDQLSRITFDKMGSIFHDWDKPLSDISSYKVGPIIDDDLNYDLRLDFPVTRGPFISRREYHRARIDFCLAEALDPRMKERAEYWTPRREAKKAWSDLFDMRMEYQQKRNSRNNDEEDEREAKLKYMDGVVRTKPPLIPPSDNGRHERLKAALCPRNEAHDDSDARYCLEELAAMPTYCMRLQRILPFLIDDPPFAPGSCAFHNPDMHNENMIIDAASGTVLAIIDWEKCFTTPIRYTSRYPKFVITDDDEDGITEPDAWTSDEPKPGWLLREESLWQEHLEDVRLREIFDGCLEQRASPFLAPRIPSGDDSPERLLSHRIWSMAEFCTERDEVLEGWEKMAKERFMDL